MRLQAIGVVRDPAHLLDGRDDQSVRGRGALQRLDKHAGVLGGLNLVAVTGKVPVGLQRLRAQLDPVQQEHHLVGVLGVGDELG
ncbi:hypothetical protein D3C81_1999260 [compost metagenome]